MKLVTTRIVLLAIVVPLLSCAGSRPAGRLVEPGGSTSVDTAWTAWAPRPEIAPRFVEEPPGPEGLVLRIEGAGRSVVHGAWKRLYDGIAGGRTYRFTAAYRTEALDDVARSLSARVEWQDGAGRRLRMPDQALDPRPSAGRVEGGWSRIDLVTPAPPEARRAVVELAFSGPARASVRWSSVALREEKAPPDRVARLMAVRLRPRGTRSPAESVERFCALVASAADRKADLICLPEGITVIGTGMRYDEVAEPVPGPTTRRLGELAKALRAYVVAGLYERVGPVVFNTAVVIDRAGGLAGTYRKVHLPAEEVEAGITPGDAWPVFDTDFGRIGVMICWDLQFPEAARALAVRGAEVICLPIWGGAEVLARARAVENCVYLVSSSYDMKTFMVDPAGTVLAEAERDGTVAVAEVRLDRPLFQPWVGDMRRRTWVERRADTGPAR